jgi:hypothetical protein
VNLNHRLGLPQRRIAVRRRFGRMDRRTFLADRPRRSNHRRPAIDRLVWWPLYHVGYVALFGPDRLD